jgi:hypothetical protein
MNCNKLRSDLISGIINEDVENHIAQCKSCAVLHQQVSEAMALLDQEVTVPAGMAASILQKRGELNFPKVRKLNLNSFVQVAAAIMFGVFIGHKFGKIAGSHTITKKQDSISQYYKAHHFNVNKASFISSPLYTKNQDE